MGLARGQDQVGLTNGFPWQAGGVGDRRDVRDRHPGLGGVSDWHPVLGGVGGLEPLGQECGLLEEGHLALAFDLEVSTELNIVPVGRKP